MYTYVWRHIFMYIHMYVFVCLYIYVFVYIFITFPDEQSRQARYRPNHIIHHILLKIRITYVYIVYDNIYIKIVIIMHEYRHVDISPLLM
jgi:hypothetical protein